MVSLAKPACKSGVTQWLDADAQWEQLEETFFSVARRIDQGVTLLRDDDSHASARSFSRNAHRNWDSLPETARAEGPNCEQQLLTESHPQAAESPSLMPRLLSAVYGQLSCRQQLPTLSKQLKPALP